MNSFQKAVKYCAIAFAIALSITIIFGIVSAVGAIVSVATGDAFFHDGGDTVDFDKEFTGENISSLDIDISAGTLRIETGDTFRVEAKNVPEDFQAEVSGDGTLAVDQTKNGIYFWGFHFRGASSPNARIIVYLPENFVAKDATISTGAGSVSVERLHSENLTVSTGTGGITGKDMTAKRADIDGGVGSGNFDGVSFTDADIKCGVGSLKLKGELLGDTSVDCGIGEVRLDLRGNAKDYDLDVDSGIGAIRVNGEKIKDEYKSNRNAVNSIEVDGGIGTVDINFDDSDF